MALEAVVVVVEEVTAHGVTEYSLLLVSCIQSHSSVVAQYRVSPMKVQINYVFYPVSIQQASVLSSRGEEVSKGVVRKAAGYFEAVI